MAGLENAMNELFDSSQLSAVILCTGLDASVDGGLFAHLNDDIAILPYMSRYELRCGAVSEERIHSCVVNGQLVIFGVVISPSKCGDELTKQSTFFAEWQGIFRDVIFSLSISTEAGETIFRHESTPTERKPEYSKETSPAYIQTEKGIFVFIQLRLSLETDYFQIPLTATLSLIRKISAYNKPNSLAKSDESILRSLISQSRHRSHQTHSSREIRGYFRMIQPLHISSQWKRCIGSCIVSLTVSNAHPEYCILVRSLTLDLNNTRFLAHEDRWSSILNLSQVFSVENLNAQIFNGAEDGSNENEKYEIIPPLESQTYLFSIRANGYSEWSSSALEQEILACKTADVNSSQATRCGYLHSFDNVVKIFSSLSTFVWSYVDRDPHSAEFRLTDNVSIPRSENSCSEKIVSSRSVAWLLKPSIPEDFIAVFSGPSSARIMQMTVINLIVSNQADTIKSLEIYVPSVGTNWSDIVEGIKPLHDESSSQTLGYISSENLIRVKPLQPSESTLIKIHVVPIREGVVSLGRVLLKVIGTGDNAIKFQSIETPFSLLVSK